MLCDGWEVGAAGGGGGNGVSWRGLARWVVTRLRSPCTLVASLSLLHLLTRSLLIAAAHSTNPDHHLTLDAAFTPHIVHYVIPVTPFPARLRAAHRKPPQSPSHSLLVITAALSLPMSQPRQVPFIHLDNLHLVHSSAVITTKAVLLTVFRSHHNNILATDIQPSIIIATMYVLLTNSLS